MMEIKHLALDEVARLAGIPYTTASELLNGRKINPARLAALRRVIQDARMPEATV